MQPSTIQQTEDSSMKVGIIVKDHLFPVTVRPDGKHDLLPFSDASGVVRYGFLPTIKGEQLTLRKVRTKEDLVLKFQIGAKSIQLPLPADIDEDALFSTIEKIIHALI